MTNNINQAFIKEFQAQVHEAYQRMGSKLRPFVRNIDNVRGSSTVFQTVGKGSATTKSRNAAITTMTMSQSTVECTLSDYYAGDWIDRLDELKTNINERQIIANAGAYALGRKTDDLVITALGNLSSTRNITNNSVIGLKESEGLTKKKVLGAFEKLGEDGVQDDGERYAVIGWKQWSDLMDIDEFANSDYIGSDELPWRGTQAKRWLGALWIPHSGLPISSSKRSCFWFHKSAIGLATGQDIVTDITWHGDRAAFFVNNMMSQGAVVIDSSGVTRMICTE